MDTEIIPAAEPLPLWESSNDRPPEHLRGVSAKQYELWVLACKALFVRIHKRTPLVDPGLKKWAGIP